MAIGSVVPAAMLVAMATAWSSVMQRIAFSSRDAAFGAWATACAESVKHAIAARLSLMSIAGPRVARLQNPCRGPSSNLNLHAVKTSGVPDRLHHLAGIVVDLHQCFEMGALTPPNVVNWPNGHAPKTC
jgi:hypothetical protein